MSTELHEYVETFYKKVRSLQNADETAVKSERDVYHTTAGFGGGGERKSEVRAKRSTRRRAFKLYSRKMAHRQLKRDGMYDYELGDRTYRDFLPMNDLWKQYMAKILGHFTPEARVAVDVIGAKLLKADFHGAFLTVQESQTPSLVGHSGIVLFEYRNSFLLVTKDSRLIKVPKQGTVFASKACGLILRLHGSQLRYKASERSVQKFRVQFKANKLYT